VSIDALRRIDTPAAPETAKQTAERQQVATAAKEFEAMFLLQMLKQMRQSMLAEEADEPGLGAATMMETMDAELSRHLAGQRGGLSTIIEHALMRDAHIEPTSAPASNVPVNEPTHAIEPTPIGLPRVSGHVSSEFGWRRDPITGESRFHRGLDVAAAYGEEVPVAAAGTVTFSGTQNGYGKVVIVQHPGGTETRYAHLSQLDVRTGDDLKAGDVVGRVGQSGRATAPHLHFELRQGGKAVDPAAGSQLPATSSQREAGSRKPEAVIKA
jgi:murein DD-endopeptidase MepM/ murein hydrolase activator NlpD